VGLLIVKICCGKLSFDTLGCNKALALIKVAFIPTTWLFDFILDKECQDGG